ncbi:MAG TPA: sulfite exporter TauE/SafE family protein [Pirellulales bacterium]|nr:sulfite exporter TauE/SafE family protein [Pirellulales bacterium]
MLLTPLRAVMLVAAGAATGVLGAILGIGGGVFLIPVLVIGLGLPMHEAVGTSIISVIATSTAVASTNVERGTANMRLGMTLEIATALGAIAGGLTAHTLSPQALEGLFAAVLVPCALLMWRGRTEHASNAASPTTTVAPDISLGRLGAAYFDSALREQVSYRVERLPFGLLISFIAGNLSGLLGIGGGVFKVPALHLLCHVPVKAAAATSNFMIGVTAVASAFLYYGRGEVRPALTAAVVLGVLGGSALGSVLNQYLGGRAIQRLFAVLLVAVAAQMLYRSIRGA